jgi:N-methylhydantoinase B
MTDNELFTYETRPFDKALAASADPVTTELVRNALNSAGDQMKRALIRASFSPIISESLDFAVVLYDKQIRLLAQAPSLPVFMGTMNFCIEGALAGVGGAETLEPGDVLLYNSPYGTGSHAQDAAIVIPVFLDGALVGYAACKAHWMDIGAKNPYCTDTTDVYQEGVFFPGIKLYRKGEVNSDIVAMIRANTRLPDEVMGDVSAQVACCRVGARELARIINQYGLETFTGCVERMFDHAEKVTRAFLEKIPDGYYASESGVDNSGVDDEPISFKVGLEVKGSEVTVDMSQASPALKGPMNCPLPSTVSFARVAIGMLANTLGHANEGHFRPIKVVTKPGTMFHPEPPAPCFLFGWSIMPAMEAILKALGEAKPELVCARSGGCILTLTWWGVREKTGQVWAAGSPLPVGQGGHVHGDGGTMIHASMAFSQVPPMELWEAKFPWVVEQYELAIDSAGPGTNTGGPGIDIAWRMLEDCSFTSTIEQTKYPAWGLTGGSSGQANSAEIIYPDGRVEPFAKVTDKPAPKGSLVRIRCGSGGGFGPAGERDPDRVRADVRGGYITEEFARQHYPQAFRGLAA